MKAKHGSKLAAIERRTSGDTGVYRRFDFSRHQGLIIPQNQLVAARMRNEELETELVRYKLL